METHTLTGKEWPSSTTLPLIRRAASFFTPNSTLGLLFSSPAALITNVNRCIQEKQETYNTIQSPLEIT
jgi:hypothetical protein